MLPRLPGRVPRRRALVPLTPVHAGRLGSIRHGERRLAHHGSRSRRRSTRRACSSGSRGDLGAEARELARRSEARRLAVSRDDETIFVYAGDARRGRAGAAVVEAELREHGIEARTSRIEHWLDGRGALGRRAAGRDVGGRGARARATRRGRCASSAARARRRASSRTGSRPRATSPSAASTTSSSAPRATRTRTRWPTRLHGEVEPGGELVWEASPTQSRSPSSAASAARPPVVTLELTHSAARGILPGASLAQGNQPSAHLLKDLQHDACCAYARSDSAADTLSEAADPLVAAALRAEAWAGEPFLREGEDPARGARRRHRPPARARRGDRGDGRAAGRAVAAVEGPLRPPARPRARARRAGAAHRRRHRAPPPPGRRARGDAHRAHRREPALRRGSNGNGNGHAADEELAEQAGRGRRRGLDARRRDRGRGAAGGAGRRTTRAPSAATASATRPRRARRSPPPASSRRPARSAS